MTMAPITVREIADGDFQVVRGGDVYRKGRAGAVPGTVRPGERVSASEICEWMTFGVEVKDNACQ